MNTPRDAAGPKAELDRTLAGIRRRWRTRRVLEGAALAGAIVLLAAFGAVIAMDTALFEPGVVSAARTGFYIMAGIALALLVLPPAVRRMPNALVARYVESRSPGLDALMLSAVEARESMDGNRPATNDTSPALAEKLVGTAAGDCGASPAVAGLERPRTRRAAGGIAGVVALAAALVLLGPEAWRHGAGLLVSPAGDPAAVAGPYTIRVAPGDVSILAGEDVHISATPEGFRPESLVLASRAEGEETWTRTPLAPSPDAGAFETYLFDVKTSREYRVEHESLSSSGHRIDVIPRPLAERIDLRYEFPEYTGRPPELVTGGGDISAVRGTRVEVRVTPSSPTPGGRLVMNGERSIPLQAGDNGDLRATIEIADNGRYRVELEAGDYGMAPASPEHAIIAHADDLPNIELLSPGRDVSVTSIEQIIIEARAQDDVAVRGLELVMSVNGGPDQVVDLVDDSAPRPAMTARHELFLEERSLAPGDLIAYYLRARDTAGDPERQTSSDIFFMDVRPFEMNYRRAGGGGGGGGQQSEETLAAQQRTLVVALFKLLRDDASMEEEVFEERARTLGTAQTRIRERVDAIVRRLESRSIVERSPAYERMAEELPQASKSMIEVEALLAVEDVDDAMPPARQALLHLQRADSAFRDAQVAQGQSGGGGSAAQNDLANLFRLEMDRFRSPYEDAQRGDWTPPEQRIDDVLRKLSELAERQQREMERSPASGERGGGDRQRALAEELEKLARELERLTRQQPNESLQASLDEVEQAARAMRQSADGAGGGAGADAETLQRLREAQRLLDSEGASRLAGETREALRRAEAMRQAQADIERETSGDPSGPQGDENDTARIAERKHELAGDVESMESELDRLADEARRSRRTEASDTLEGAAGALRDERVAERIRRSVDSLDAQGSNQGENQGDSERGGPPGGEEAGISRALDDLRDRIASAARHIGEGDGQRLSRLHEELRDTMRDLDRGQERLADSARRGAPGSGSRADAQTPATEDIRRVLEGGTGALDGIVESIRAEPGMGADVDALRDAVEDVRRSDRADPNALAQRHAALLTALQDIERELRARLGEEQSTAWGATRSEPSPAQREAVERYYRNLSERASP